MGKVTDLEHYKLRHSFEFREELIENDEVFEVYIRDNEITPAVNILLIEYNKKKAAFRKMEAAAAIKEMNVVFTEVSALQHLLAFRNAEQELLKLRRDLVDALLQQKPAP